MSQQRVHLSSLKLIGMGESVAEKREERRGRRSHWILIDQSIERRRRADFLSAGVQRGQAGRYDDGVLFRSFYVFCFFPRPLSTSHAVYMRNLKADK